METGQRPAGDGDEQEGEQRTGDRPVRPTRSANSLNAGTVMTGRTMMIATASSTIVPTFMNVDR